jgi:hypothetical protein
MQSSCFSLMQQHQPTSRKGGNQGQFVHPEEKLSPSSETGVSKFAKMEAFSAGIVADWDPPFCETLKDFSRFTRLSALYFCVV